MIVDGNVLANVAWMMLQDLLPQVLAVDVHVDLGGTYLLVSEHLLDDAQVGPSLEQMGGETMSEGVWRDGGADAYGRAEHLDDMENGDARECCAATMADEDGVFVARAYVDLLAVDEP